MKSVRKNKSLALAFLVLLLFPVTFLGCASTQLVGKWKEVGKAATIEFFGNGTFKAVDSQGMAVSGKYFLSKDGNLRCEIPLSGGIEVIKLMITIRGDELTFTSSGSAGVETYKRERYPVLSESTDAIPYPILK